MGSGVGWRGRVSMSITVLTADHQPLMRSALRMCLAAEPDLELLGEAADGQEAVELAHRLRPDVILVDIRMPKLDGIAVTRRLVAELPTTKVLVLTTFDLDDYIVQALRAGASGFLLKDASAEEIVHAIRVIADGHAMLAPKITRRLLDWYAHRLPGAPLQRLDILKRLTKRELEVLGLVSRGFSNSEIGRALHVADSSVKSHVSHVLTKLGMADRVQLVILAYETGLVLPGTM
jgi:DNA-binding NarL/FixJ family response regulator